METPQHQLLKRVTSMTNQANNQEVYYQYCQKLMKNVFMNKCGEYINLQHSFRGFNAQQGPLDMTEKAKKSNG